MSRKLTIFLLSAACCAAPVWAQGRRGGQAQAPLPNVSSDPLLRGFEFRSIGPATMMGRVDDIEGSEKDPMIVYMGFATGGLWKSTDGGNHWKALFEEMPNASIGSIGIAPSDPNVVYVGMGEGNNRQSSSIGDGVWGTTDGGAHWTHLGLEETQAIQRVAVDPTNPQICYVAAGGHLFGSNPERGLYKTIDGGKTWKNVKFLDNDTGFTDVAIDPSNPKTVYAASYSRRRTWWGFNGGGANSALWKTTDAGATWTKLDGEGWPKAKDGIYGRIAISVYKSNPKIVYAQVEVGASAGTGGGTAADGGPQRGRGGFGGGSESDVAGPAAGTPGAAGAAGAGGGGGGGGRGGRGGPPAPPDPQASGVFRSEDGGKTWKFMSNQNQRPMYFSQIRVDPNNDQKIFVGGNPGQISLDGGKTWGGIAGSHTDYHAFWINPKDSRIVFVGHDGGMDMSTDGGVTWDYHNDIAVGQFYQVSADMRRPYYVCGGLQDNNAWCGPSALRSNSGPVNTDWFTVAGGDGFYTRQDPTDWAIVYAESQDGNMVRHDLRTGTQKSIRPTTGPGRGANAAQTANPAAATTPAPGAAQPAEGTAPNEAGGGRGQGGGGRGGPPNVTNAPADVEALRFYWNAPIEISPHNPAVIYMAAQYLFKSTNRGDSWWMNKTDLSKNVNRWAPEQAIMGVSGEKPMASKHDGYAASSLATQVRESPSRPGVLWIGTDDGNLQISKDGGESFTNVAPNITGVPKGYVQISRIEPSHFDPATCYVALDNHRNDDWKPYLVKTTDYGKTWTSVAGNLPGKGNINALREDYDNPNLLFAGTEFGLFVTLDGGKEWKKFMTGLPSVRVDDILIHPRDRDLIIATHGRSIWICDDITPLEQMKSASDSDLTLFEPRPAVLWKNDPQAQRHAANREFKGTNPQGGTAINVWAKADMGPQKIEFLQGTNVVSTMDVDIKAGLNRFQWGLRGIPTVAATTGNAGGGGGRGRRGGAAGATGAAPAGQEAAAAPPAATPAPDAAAQGGRGGRGGDLAGGRVPFVLRGGGGGNGGGAGGGPNAFTGVQPPPAPPVDPAAQGGRGGGGGGGFGGFGGGGATILEPGSYMVRLTIGGKTLTTSVGVLEDIWMRPQ
jgi:photosystem II stability/assembly factor-like uncharacterized protein